MAIIACPRPEGDSFDELLRIDVPGQTTQMNRTQEILDRANSETVSPELVFQAVCKDVGEHTGANRVSIWRFENGGDSIRCVSFYKTQNGTFTKGQVLSAKDQLEYFKRIQTDHFIVASDARNHPATAEFTDQYFAEHDIYSLLDFILHDKFVPVGVICCENAGEPREWSDDDVSYLRQVSTLISFRFKIE